jgi:hypothetical protein
VLAMAPSASKTNRRDKKHQKDRKGNKHKKHSSSSSSSSSCSSSSSKSPPAVAALMPEAPPERKPVFFKRSALPAGSATYRMLPYVVLKEILHVIKPDTFTGDDNTPIDQIPIRHATVNSVLRQTSGSPREYNIGQRSLKISPSEFKFRKGWRSEVCGF